MVWLPFGRLRYIVALPMDDSWEDDVRLNTTVSRPTFATA
jgi:hypothetical protein